jgi:hypothetical protein
VVYGTGSFIAKNTIAQGMGYGISLKIDLINIDNQGSTNYYKHE